jgi:hypothetical protein
LVSASSRKGFAVLESAGVGIDHAKATVMARERGMFIGRHGEYRIDVFVASVAFYEEARTRRARVRLARRETPPAAASIVLVGGEEVEENRRRLSSQFILAAPFLRLPPCDGTSGGLQLVAVSH